MKVLQIINSLNTGGAEKILCDTIPLYRKKGIEMDLLLLNGTKYPLLEELEIKSDCKIFSLGEGSPYNPFLIFKIIPFLKKYDVVHVHLFPALYWVSFAKLLSISKTKIIFTEHNTTNNRRSKTLLKLFDRIVYRQYDTLITISEIVDSNLKNYLPTKNFSFKLIKNGVDLLKIFNAKPLTKSSFEQNEDKKILIQVSSFTAQKDQKTLIRSLVHLPENTELWLVGDGPLKKDCEKEVDSLLLKARVKFLGIRMDVPALLKTADVVVLSSKHEGLSLASIEGMASGKPFIASDVPGLTDVVKGAGILFSQGNERMLAEKILELLNNPSLYSSISEACVERSKEYNIEIMVNKHIDLYKSIL